MKSKRTRSQGIVTKTILRDELDKALDKTKKELRVEIALSKYDLKDEMRKMDEKNMKYRDDVLTAIDGVVKELETMREENVVGAHRLRDHEKRIIALESAA